MDLEHKLKEIEVLEKISENGSGEREADEVGMEQNELTIDEEQDNNEIGDDEHDAENGENCHDEHGYHGDHDNENEENHVDEHSDHDNDEIGENEHDDIREKTKGKKKAHDDQNSKNQSAVLNDGNGKADKGVSCQEGMKKSEKKGKQKEPGFVSKQIAAGRNNQPLMKEIPESAFR